MDVCSAIDVAKACVAKMSARYAESKTFGNRNDKLFYDLLTMNAYIRTLERNKVKEREIRTKNVPEGTTVDFSSLKKQNNVLILETKEDIICTTVEVRPCLSDSEICQILEQITILCSGCIN